ncbi:MAG: MBOAT family protein, partial [Lachnospiraceae bacterium]|nr:MBOAT family protein [Lachnospiraceae bacterium]
MLFHSYEFLFAFFPLMLLGYGISWRIAERKGHKNRIKSLSCLWLFLTSFVFYGLGGVEYLPVLLASMAVN